MVWFHNVLNISGTNVPYILHFQVNVNLYNHFDVCSKTEVFVSVEQHYIYTQSSNTEGMMLLREVSVVIAVYQIQARLCPVRKAECTYGNT